MSDPHVEDERPVLLEDREVGSLKGTTQSRRVVKELPRMIQIDIRKFALEQAVNALPHLRNGVLTLDVASQFEGYILNGWTRSE